MTREELIEKLASSYDYDNPIGPLAESEFKDAIASALDAQARGCVKAARLFTYGYGDKVAEKMISHILTADPEVEG